MDMVDQNKSRLMSGGDVRTNDSGDSVFWQCGADISRERSRNQPLPVRRFATLEMTRSCAECGQNFPHPSALKRHEKEKRII